MFSTRAIAAFPSKQTEKAPLVGQAPLDIMTVLELIGLHDSFAELVLSTTAQATSATFGDLPVELKSYICDFLDHKKDLVNLCLVDRHTHDAVTPRLYNTIEIDTVDFAREGLLDRLLGLLCPDNPGLQYLRKLYIFTGTHADPAHNRRIGTLFLQMLPKNSLETFFWDYTTPMPLDTFVLLCTRQTQLRTIWIGETEDSVTNSVVARRALSKAFSSIKNLDILPVSHNTAETGEMILRTATCLRSLRLDLRRNAVASTHRFTSNPFYDREDVLHILFGEISTLSPPICLSLTTLELLEINLYASASTIIAANDFSTLKRLVIYQCEHTELFLDALIEKRKRRETSLGNLKEFLFRVEQSEQNTKALESFERFLHQVKGLRTLSARFDGAPRFPKIGCITPHGPTLEVLCIDVTDSYGVARDRYAHQDIGFLCSHLTAVTQLGLCLPVLKVDPVESQAFVKESLNHIFSLPHLTLLNILNLPSTNWSTVVDEARVLAEHVAGLVFAHERNLCRRRPTAGLRALVLGDVADDAAAVAAPARSEYLEVAFYVPMEVCWPTGPRRKKVVAAGLAWEEWRKVVGDTRVLELGGY